MRGRDFITLLGGVAASRGTFWLCAACDELAINLKTARAFGLAISPE